MSRQYWVQPIPPFSVADGTAVANTTTLTDAGPAPAIQLPANILELGSRLEFYAFGRYSTTATPTLALGIYSGTIGQAITAAAVVAASSAITTVSGAANRSWRLEGHAQVRSVGAAGTILGFGELSNVTTGATDMMPASAPATVAIDTTVTRYITIGATWGTASASNTLTVHYFGVRLVN